MILTEQNYKGIVDVAENCDYHKLRIAEDTSFEYDLREVFCDIWDKLKDTQDEEILNGNSEQGGLLKIWALFSYARYVDNSIYIDTGSGFVRKDNGNSFPIQLSEIKAISKQHRDMAQVEIKRFKRFLCKEKDICGSKCYCEDETCTKRTKSRLFVRRGRNVNREGL